MFEALQSDGRNSVRRKQPDPLSSSDQAALQEPERIEVLNGLEAARQALAATSTFVVKVDGTRLIATRRRPLLPRRGIFRLLIPHARAVVTAGEGGLRASVRPDPLALFMVLMLVGGIASELFMNRVKYPRTYPPEFIYGLATLYIGALAVEMIRTKRQVHALLRLRRR
jgi:hypothetical protein